MNMPWKNSTPALSPLAIAASVPAPAAAKLNHNFSGIIDQLGSVRAQIKALEKVEETLAEQVQALGPGEHDGTKCRAVVTTVSTERLDTKSLKAALPEAMIAAHTKTSESVRVSIKALV